LQRERGEGRGERGGAFDEKDMHCCTIEVFLNPCGSISVLILSFQTITTHPTSLFLYAYSQASSHTKHMHTQATSRGVAAVGT
jgi:hypothetical protein